MKKRWILFVLAMMMLAAFAVGCNCNGNEGDSFDFKLLSSSVIIKKGESTRIKTNYSGEEPVIYVSGEAQPTHLFSLILTTPPLESSISILSHENGLL